MRRAVVLATILAAVVGACGTGAAGTGEVSTTAPRGEPIVIRLRLVIADTEGAEVVSTGEVLEGSTVGDASFCTGGTTEDRHASEDPAVEPYRDRQALSAVTRSEGGNPLAHFPPAAS